MPSKIIESEYSKLKIYDLQLWGMIHMRPKSRRDDTHDFTLINSKLYGNDPTSREDNCIPL